MNFQEMEALARAPQDRVNLHVIEKLENIEGNQLDASLLLDLHGKAIGAIEKRCGPCHRNVKTLAAALTALAGAVWGAFKFWKG